MMFYPPGVTDTARDSPQALTRAILAVFAAGFLLRFLPYILWPAVAQADELFQALEQGHRLVFGYGLVPWEFDYGARSWLLGYFSAGPMQLAKLIGAGPDFYIPLIAALLSMLGALTSLCAFSWGRRQFGLYGGLAVAFVSTLWVDNVYFGARSFGEVIGGHLLILAIWLAEPRETATSRRRLLLAGLIAGAALMLRIHLAPALGLIWLWGGLNRRRWLWLSLGAVTAIALNGAFDMASGHGPFEPLLRNMHFNVVEGGAAFFGTDPWWGYFHEMGAKWGGSIGIVLPLAFLGARRKPMLLVMAVLIIASHSFIGHKEYRFIVPAIQLLAILAGFGLVDVTRIIIAGLKSRGSTVSSKTVITALSASWVLLCIVNYVGRDYQNLRDRDHDNLLGMRYVSNMPDVCGVGLHRVGAYNSGGYTWLHRRVPMYWGAHENPDKVYEKIAGYNVIVATRRNVPNDLVPVQPVQYKKEACFDTVCVYRRPGACAPLLPPAPNKTDLGRDTVLSYPYAGGIN